MKFFIDRFKFEKGVVEGEIELSTQGEQPQATSFHLAYSMTTDRLFP